VSCLICVQLNPGGACHARPEHTYVSAHLGALYIVMSMRASIEEHFNRFLGSLCHEHLHLGQGFMAALIADEDDLAVRRRLEAVLSTVATKVVPS